MLFRSGSTHHSNLLDMESKLNLILKELQDLKLRGLENKNKESSRDDNRDRREEKPIDIGMAKMT